MTCNNIKILFIGTVEFSFKALQTLLENKFEITGLITKKKSKFNSDFYDLSTTAKENNIPIIYRTKDNENELVSFINLNKSDVIYCFGWSHILPTSILSIPKYGVIGFHPAELPNNRGRHPLIWALFLGLKQTASTFFFMVEGTDTGDSISQEKIKISYDDAYSLYNKIIDNLIKESTTLSLRLFNNFNILLDNLNINYKKMEGNLLSEKDYIASENLMYNLAEHIGRQDAHDTIHSVIQKSMTKNISVMESLAKDKTISNFFTTLQIDEIMNPLKYIGESKKISLNVKNVSLKYVQKIIKRASSFDLLVRS